MAPTTRRTAAAAQEGVGKSLKNFKPSKPVGVTKSKATSKKTTVAAAVTEVDATSSAVGGLPATESTAAANGVKPKGWPKASVAAPASAAKGDDTYAPPVTDDTGAQPATNAPLALPGAPLTAPPAVPPPRSPTSSALLRQAEAHLIAVSPSLAPLIAAHPCPLFAPAGLAEVVDPFTSLASGIISQQVSGAAARSIKAKFVALFEPELTAQSLRFPAPRMVLSLSPATLQTAGVSARKAVYLHSLAAAFTSSAITPQFLSSATDEEIVAELTKIHGIGQWSAEMFLMFGLKRMDVFSVGDLGIQRGMAAWQGRNVKALKKGGGGRGKKWKYMGEKEMMDLAAPFGPYRTLFCWYMWRCEGTDIAAMGDVAKTE